ncbi:MAG: hypothetical protein BGO67_02195 [Alphaproteobacteria bacterium 41-28]|nr:MAG: hypothetical protein BGO67_02195 [Alphaproteobacteria bacterium 41-28]
MKLGKSKWVVSFALAGGLLCSSYNVSYGDDTDSLIQAESSGDLNILCRKANASQKIFSLRSFEGRACKQPQVAAFAVLLCGGKGDFNGSGCDKKAKTALGKDYNDPKGFLIRSAKTAGAKIRTLICSQQDKLPSQFKTVVAQVCPGAPAQSPAEAESPSN